MQDSNDTPNETQVIEIIGANDEQHHYDTDKLNDFMDVVFHTELLPGEEILTWRVASGHHPRYPEGDERLLSLLNRTTAPCALYFGTSTCVADAEGTLYNRKSLFKRLFVVVLDDIGGKIDPATMPDDLTPTYIIESSAGNYQWGFVLEDPIDDLAQAEALIQLVYESGYTDSGGKMATKLVRLPDGVNGKKGVKRLFPVEQIKADGPLWTPDRLLSVLDLGISWAEVCEDAEQVYRRKTSTARLSAWSPLKPTAVNLNGTIDPLLEWLYARGDVVQETNVWTTIECPWGHEHTQGDTLAGYSSIGRGGENHDLMRGFNCFHDSCSTKTIHDLLKLAAADGLYLGVRDDAAELIAQWAYNPTTDGVEDITWGGDPVRISFNAFRNLYPQMTFAQTGKKAPEKIAVAALWRNSLARVTVFGHLFDPSTTNRIVTRGDKKFINRFKLPDWQDGPFDQSEIDKFTDFLKYLLPINEQCEFFIDWLAAKAQNMAFRGPAILMVAPQQGTGRTTLSNMISTLFGPYNLEHVPFDVLTGNAQFNDYLERPFIVTDETLNVGDAPSSFYRVYERLKEIVDTVPKEIRINPKYGLQRQSTIYTSFLFFSNHEAAMALSENDRRFYVISNAPQRQSPSYFTELNAWIANDEWARHVWRWLLARDVDLEPLMRPVLSTEAKKAMHDATRSPLDMAIGAVLSLLPEATFITGKILEDIIMPFAPRLRFHAMAHPERALVRAAESVTQALPRNWTVRRGGKTVRARIITARQTPDLMNKIQDVTGKEDLIKLVQRDITAWDSIPDLHVRMSEALDLLE